MLPAASLAVENGRIRKHSGKTGGLGARRAKGYGGDSRHRSLKISGRLRAGTPRAGHQNCERTRPGPDLELAQLLNVTEPTVRKDITDLEAQGLLVRAHGGAVARGSMAEVDVATRETKNLREKRLIARACHGLIRDGDSVFLDGGTTQHELAKLLATADSDPRPGRRGVKILTNSFKVGEVCAAMTLESPIVLGGRYRPIGRVFVGPITMSVLRQFRVDIAFIGVTGVTKDGFCGADIAEAEIKTELTNRAERVVVPMDHSKIGLAGLPHHLPT